MYSWGKGGILGIGSATSKNLPTYMQYAVKKIEQGELFSYQLTFNTQESRTHSPSALSSAHKKHKKEMKKLKKN